MRTPAFVVFSMVALLLIGLGGVPRVQGHSGDVLSSFGTATVDGVISPGEYGSCIGPITQGPYTFTICETNDETYDYYALQISGDTTPPSCDDPTDPVCHDYFEMWFDNTHDGTLSSCSSGGVEDVLFLRGPSGIFLDLWECFGPHGDYDSVEGGSSDGVGAVNEASTPYVFEMSHPLYSGDPNDYSLNVGSTVGWCMAYLDNDVEIVRYPVGCMGWESAGSQSLFGNVVKADAPPPLWTDRSYYYLGETVTVFLSYSRPQACTTDVVTYDVIAVHDGSQVALLDTFGGSSTVGCWDPKEYTYSPTDDGLYTVQFVRTDSPLLIGEAEFQVGYVDSNGLPVGGVMSPVNTLAVLSPWLAVIGLVGCVGVVAVVIRRRRQ